jgi:hypothetical protein
MVKLNESVDDEITTDSRLVQRYTDDEAAIDPVIDGPYFEVAGRKIYRKEIKPGQMAALQRFRDASMAQVNKIRADKGTADIDKIEMLGDIWQRFDLKFLLFIESLVIDPEDIDFIADAQITGDIDVAGLLKAVFHPDEPVDDDEDPVAKAPAKKMPNPMKKAAAAKKTANARRAKK